MLKHFKDCAYERPDIPGLQAEMEQAAQRVREAGRYEEVRREILLQNERNKALDQAIALAYIRHYGDAADEFYAGEFNELMPAAAALNPTALNTALVESPFAAQVDGEFGPRYLNLTRNRIRLDSAGHELMAREQALMAEYQQIKATLKVKFAGRGISEAEAEKLADSPDRAIRKSVRRAIFAAYLEKREDFVRILEALVPLRLGIAEANGFSSYLDYMNLEKGREGYGEAELAAFCEQVKAEVVPFTKWLGQVQAKRLGLERLMPYDRNLLFPDGNPEPGGNADFLLEAAKDMYDDLSPETGAFFRLMLDKGLLDVKASPNKIAGMGFCTVLPEDKLPFVFGNCNGMDWDINVITHEMGHAFQIYLAMARHELTEYFCPCNDIAEVPSKTMEHFTSPYAQRFCREGDGEKYRFKQLQDALEEVVGYCAIHEYESWLYTHPQAGAQERIRMYETVQRRYRPDLDYSEFREEVEGGALLFRSMAVYMFPLYVISYALSAMCAMAFREGMARDRDRAWAGYLKLCEAGGSLGYPELIALAGLPCAYAPGAVKTATAGIKAALREYIEGEGLA